MFYLTGSRDQLAGVGVQERSGRHHEGLRLHHLRQPRQEKQSDGIRPLRRSHYPTSGEISNMKLSCPILLSENLTIIANSVLKLI
jgi:hypothetical protein